jgi:hypothetical protein
MKSKQDEVMNRIINELEETEAIKRVIKEQSMTYQYSLKIEVSKTLGLTFDQVDLPYEQWKEIRDKYFDNLTGQ